MGPPVLSGPAADVQRMVRNKELRIINSYPFPARSRLSAGVGQFESVYRVTLKKVHSREGLGRYARGGGVRPKFYSTGNKMKEWLPLACSELRIGHLAWLEGEREGYILLRDKTL